MTQTLGRLDFEQQPEHQQQLNKLCEEFDETTLKERQTFAGGFQAVGVVPWVLAFVVTAVLSAPLDKSHATAGEVLLPYLLLMWFPAVYRAGDSLAGGLVGKTVFFGNPLWVALAVTFEEILRFLVYVAIGLGIAPLHAVVLAWKWFKFMKMLRQGTASW